MWNPIKFPLYNTPRHYTNPRHSYRTIRKNSCGKFIVNGTKILSENPREIDAAVLNDRTTPLDILFKRQRNILFKKE